MTVIFPSSVTDVLATALTNISGLATIERASSVTPEKAVFRRMLRPTDPCPAIGIMSDAWEPDTTSYEVGSNLSDPTLSTYTWVIQLMVKMGNREDAQVASSTMGKDIRSMLARDSALRVALQSLSQNFVPGVERVQRWGCRGQRFANDEANGEFIFLTSTDFWLQTESL